MTEERNIYSLRPGEAGYTTAHAAWLSGDDMLLHGDYPLRAEASGTFVLRLVKFPDGHLAVDLSECRDVKFSWVPGFGGHVEPVVVDSYLEPPQCKPDSFRVWDLPREEIGYMRPTDAWVFDGRMFLNGHTELSPEFTDDCTLRVSRRSSGAYVVDVSHVGNPNYPAGPPEEDQVFPIQVLKATRDHTDCRGS